MPADDPEYGEPELDAAHVDAAWRDIMANYGDPAMPATETPEAVTPTPEQATEPMARPVAEPEAEPEWWEREEHFTPPEPPRAPLPLTARGLAWLGTLGLPTLMIVLAIIRVVSLPGWLVTIGVLAFLVSLGYLFATMPTGHDDDPFDGNNGAVV